MHAMCIPIFKSYCLSRRWKKHSGGQVKSVGSYAVNTLLPVKQVVSQVQLLDTKKVGERDEEYRSVRKQ